MDALVKTGVGEKRAASSAAATLPAQLISEISGRWKILEP